MFFSYISKYYSWYVKRRLLTILGSHYLGDGCDTFSSIFHLYILTISQKETLGTLQSSLEPLYLVLIFHSQGS
ncbi:hypothetical protein AMBR_CKHPCMOK_00390 [Lacticaseibacillus rhamnosus]|uniref:Uncharacterized protein n=1 Tax=Lacticaseibacillus rhamnosus TaxID=47715 RepID=A0A6N3ATJ7_LACRH|nr:hypothetical protein AMBR_BLFENHAL_00029 [Lacticaseibacillus rhamnosus]VTU59705.1 hypothetical protein AMBR_NBBOBCOC_00631 [Lacticaseibacillus rhamnosus]VTU66191.1 hypothetical protein AMBR_CKHPCMOK_00390 [Lacticaseibacillus rhamnosus]VTU72594.1 hypothetical protein AMBR_EADFOONE_01299 [Lacticaseibacillus rhamnosus]